jgi:CHAT domain-containing protein
VREVSRFAAWSPKQRAGKVRGDSARRAGITAFSRDGAAAAIRIWRRALPVFGAIADTAGTAATLANIGAGLARDGSPDSAEHYLDRALVLATRIGDYRVQANAISELAGLCESRNDLAGANERYGRAIALRVRIGDSRGLASDYNNLAGIARAAGDLELARRQLETALKINRRDDRPEVAATNLVNLAALAGMRGDFTRAIAFYNEALTTWKMAARFADIADAHRGLGDVELRRGDYRSAQSHLAQALAIYERTGPLGDELGVRQALASTSAARGDLQAAVDELRIAQRLADSARAEPAVRGGIALARADLATQLNQRSEAERLFAFAQSQFNSAGDRDGEAEAQQGRASILLDRDDAVGAGTLLDAALRTQTATGNRRAAALTRLLLGEVALHRGDTSAARLYLTRAATELTRLGDPIAAANAIGQRASLEAAASSPAAADSLYRAAIAVIGDRVAPDATWRLHAGLGAALRSRGATEEASRALRLAIAAIEGSGRSLAMPERRSAFLTDKWDPYLQLALLEEARGRVPAAFDVSERLRANEMLGMLSMGRLAVPADAAADLTLKEQDLRHRIAELTRALEGDGTGRTDRGPDISRGAAVTREALLRAQATYSEVQLEMRERAPRHATLVSRTTSTARDVKRRLARDEVFVEYLLSDERSIAFVITRDTVVAVRLPVSRHEIAQLVDFARGTLQPGVSPRVDSLWRAPLRQLYADLIAPIEATGLLEKTTRVTIVPHAELHYLPFAALLNGGGRNQFLIERYEVTVTPSASVWLALASRARVRPSTGFIAFAPRPDALPWSRQEVTVIARLGGAGTRVMIGNTATERAFRGEASTRRVIHLATYGVLNKQNPLFSFVEFARGNGDDGRLEAHEVFGMQLTADLVVLSACQTGLASGALTDVPPGDDWVGLVRAFLSAGAGGVMASLWPVQDQATAQLMEQFYTRYTARVAPARALAEAQRAMIATPSTSHPYQWAGFAMVGSR